MDWMPIVSTAAGGVVALSGTLIADLRRSRTQRSRERELECWQNCIDFTLALDSAHGLLREVARTDAGATDRPDAAGDAIGRSGLYRAREKLLVSATPDLVTAGEAAFRRLIEIRDAVRSGAALRSESYHRAYHDFAEALWGFRMRVRTDFGHRPLTPQDLHKASWSEREQCVHCGQPA
ncbi:hypothetical protein ACNTMW_13265 [Planosporangium sp. 12N6]|uniref:hypothetical protein n=1 Tax=Planosporangium spinosum TaxID=3402278 RepID=UPI003CEA4AB7